MFFIRRKKKRRRLTAARMKRRETERMADGRKELNGRKVGNE